MAQDTFLAAASDFYGSLSALSPALPVRRRYAALRSVLSLAADQQLRDTEVAFTGLFSKLDFLYKKHAGAGADASLWHAVNAARRRFREAELTDEAELETAWPHDLKAVCLFIALVYGTPPPAALAERFPKTTQPHFRRRVRDAAERTVDCIRCSVVSWDGETIRVTREDNGDEATVRYAGGEAGDTWAYIGSLLSVGAQLGLVWPREEAGTIFPELIILHPDSLVDVTAVAGCFTEAGVSPYAFLMAKIKPNVHTPATLLGNFAGQLLDEAVYRRDIPYAESVRNFFRHNALAFATCPDAGKGFHEAAQRQKANIKHIIEDVYPEAVRSDFRSDEVMLEPSFVSPLLGLQGRMDFLDLNYRVLIEQKSGKGAFRPGANADHFAGAQPKHQVQALLYRALLHYGYAHTPYERMHAFLLYSRYADGLADTPSMPGLLAQAFRVRNQIAWLERHFSEKGFGLLDTLTPERMFPNAGGKLWEKYIRPGIEQTLAPLRTASPLEKAYYHRLMRFVAAEQTLAKVGNRTKENSGFAAVWCSTPDEKRAAGDICENLSLCPLPPEEEGGPVCDIELRLPEGGDTSGSNFRTGDSVMCYPYRPGSLPDATASMVLRCTVTAIAAGSLSLRLRSPQSTLSVFDHFAHSLWAVEHDFIESSFAALYRGTHAFLSAPRHRRDLLLGQRAPETDPTQKLHGEYGGAYFDTLVLRAKQAKDFYIVIGPPGTGKTSYGLVNILREELLSNGGGSVLLLSYTNRAVDEICAKLSEMTAEDGTPLPYIRIGSDHATAAPFRHRLLGNLAAQCDGLADTDRLLRETRVFCGTTSALSGHIALLGIKHFTLAIIDEASQILEPHLLGLLSAGDGEECAIRKFVLIGDEKQLPAVVQQTEAQSRVEEPELRAIGLTDCRLSLFERLLRLYGYDAQGRPRPEHCHLLTRQGRMHPEIAAFPNEAFYQNALRAVPLPHQREDTPKTGGGTDFLADVLATRRVVFIDCPATETDTAESDKVNKQEADVIAAVVAREARAMGKGFDPAQSIGVIVPYRNQITTVRCAVARLAPAIAEEISIDTVERYQGSQRDMIVYGFTATKYYQLSFLTGNEYTDERDGAVIDRKLNVAMTRARCRLVLTGCAALLSHDVTFHRMLSFLRSRACFFHARDVLSGGEGKTLPQRERDLSPISPAALWPQTAKQMPERLAERFDSIVAKPLLSDPRTQADDMPLGLSPAAAAQLLAYGRCSFSRSLSLYAGPETGERIVFTARDQARLYALLSFPAHFRESAALFTQHADEARELLRQTGGKAALVDIGCGAAAGALAFASVFGKEAEESAYWGVDTAEEQRALAALMTDNTQPGDAKLQCLATLPHPSHTSWAQLSARPRLVVIHLAGLAGCITPREAEKLAHTISGVARRYTSNRYVFALCHSASDAQLAPCTVLRRWAAETGITLWERVWDDEVCLMP